jgi:hypothetical protein
MNIDGIESKIATTIITTQEIMDERWGGELIAWPLKDLSDTINQICKTQELSESMADLIYILLTSNYQEASYWASQVFTD